MTAEPIKEFLVGLGFKVDEAGLERFSSRIKKATFAAAGLAAAAVASATAITKFVSGVADKFDDIGDLAARIDTTAEEILRLGFVATLTGSSLDAVKSSVENLNRVAGEASRGIGRGAKVFENLGISVKNTNGEMKDTSQLMAEVGDKIKDLGRGEQLALLSKLGIDATLIGALTEDVSGLAAEFDQLYKNAGIDSNKAAKLSGEFNDSMDRLTMSFDAIKSAVGLRFMGQVKNGIDTLRKFLVENMPKIINAVSPIIKLVLGIAEAFITIAGRIGSGIGVIIGFFGRLNDATNGWAGYILAAAAAWKIFNLAFLATPLGIILSLAAAIALLVDDFMTWREGGDTLIDWDSWKQGFDSAMEAMRALRKLFTDSFKAMFDAAASLVKLLTGDFGTILSTIGSIGGSVFGGGVPSLAPSPRTAASLAGGSQSVNQQTKIIVQGAGNPEATARAVTAQQSRVNADMVRNMQGAAR